MFYFAYLVGAWLLATPNPIDTIRFDFNELLAVLGEVWQPFLLGCLMVASVSAAAGYCVVRLYWRHSVIKRWKQRRAGREATKSGSGPAS
jgi:uncharacterized protein (DUF2062 family)